MAKLTGQTIAASYDQLLIVTGASGLTSSLQAVESGDTDGLISALQISTVGAAIDNPTADSSTEGGSLRLQSDDGALMQSGSRLGVLEFAGAEDSSNTITVGARIEAVTDAAWAADENGADMVFYTTDDNAAQAENVRIYSDSTSGVQIQNTTASSATEGGKLRLTSKDGALMAVDHRLGVVEFAGLEDGATVVVGAKISAIADAAFTATGTVDHATRLEFAVQDGTSGSDTLASPAMVLDSGGKLGVGATAPRAAIEIRESNDGGDTGITIVNTAGSGSSDETVSITAEHTTSEYVGGKITFFRSGDYSSSGQRQGGIKFYSQNNAALQLGIQINRASDGVYIPNNLGLGDSDPDEAKLSIDTITSGDYGIKIKQDNNNGSLYIDSASTGVSVIHIDGPLVDTGSVLNIDAANALTTGSAISVTSGGTVLASTVSGGLVEINHTGDTDTNVNNLLYINNDDPGSSGTIPLFINQDADAISLNIDSEATTANTILIQGATNTTGSVLNIDDCDALTTGSGIKIKSNSADNTSSRNLLHIINENNAADKTVGILIQQDGDDAHIEFTGGGGGGIKFTADIASSDSDTLDDYEEGVWTPTVTVGSGTVTVDGSYNVMNYTKIGRVVHLTGGFRVSAISSPSAGCTIGGLPFTITNMAEESGQVAGSLYITNMTGTVNVFQIKTVENDTTMELSEFAGTTSATIGDHFAVGSRIVLSLTFLV